MCIRDRPETAQIDPTTAEKLQVLVGKIFPYHGDEPDIGEEARREGEMDG